MSAIQDTVPPYGQHRKTSGLGLIGKQRAPVIVARFMQMRWAFTTSAALFGASSQADLGTPGRDRKEKGTSGEDRSDWNAQRIQREGEFQWIGHRARRRTRTPSGVNVIMVPDRETDFSESRPESVEEGHAVLIPRRALIGGSAPEDSEGKDQNP